MAHVTLTLEEYEALRSMISSERDKKEKKEGLKVF